jgi:hypothetical protein
VFQKGDVPFSRELRGFSSRIVADIFRIFPLSGCATFWVSFSQNSTIFFDALSSPFVDPARRRDRRPISTRISLAEAVAQFQENFSTADGFET